MEKKKRTWTVTLADGTRIENLTLSDGANTFHSPAKVTAEMFEGNLAEVHIAASNGDMSQCVYPEVMHNAELVRIIQPAEMQDGQWGFVLREIPEEEIYRKKIQAQLDYLAMTAEIDLEDM